MAGRFLKRAARAAHRRQNPDPDLVEKRNEHLAEQTDWRGACRFCGSALNGTIAQMKAHHCSEFEASNESRS